MSKSNKYLEKISLVEYTEFGETMESVGMADAIIACDIRELETLERVKDNQELIDVRIADLSKKLKNVKF